MKTQIHPQYYTNAQITCSCGKIYTLGSTVEKMHVELCSACHPFYTGEQKVIDTANRVKRFETIEKNSQRKQTIAPQAKKKSSDTKQDKKEIKGQQPLTLRDMLKAVQQ